MCERRGGTSDLGIGVYDAGAGSCDTYDSQVVRAIGYAKPVRMNNISRMI